MPRTTDLARARARSRSFLGQLPGILPLLAAACGLALAGCVVPPAAPAPVEPPAAAIAPAPAAPVEVTAQAVAAPVDTGGVTPPLPTPPPTPAAAPPPAGAPAGAAAAEPPSARLLASVTAPLAARFYAFSPDGALLAYTTMKDPETFEGAIALVDVATGQELRRIDPSAANGRGAHAPSLVFSPDGVLLAATHFDGALRIWDVATGNVAARLDIRAFCPGCSSALISPDFSRVLAFDGMGLRVLDAATGAPVSEIANPELSGIGDYSMGWTPDGKGVYAQKLFLDQFALVAVWDAATGELQAEIPQRVTEPGRGFASQLAAFGRDGRVMLPGPYTTRIFDLQAGRDVVRVPGREAALAAAADRLVTRDDRDQVRLWDARSGLLLAELGQARGGVCNCLAISPDGRRVAARHDQRLDIWEVGEPARPPADAPLLHAFKLEDLPAPEPVMAIPVVSQDGSGAVWNTGRAVMAWDLVTGRRTHSGALAGISSGDHLIDPNGMLLASIQPGAEGATVARVWQVEQPEPAWELQPEEDLLTAFGRELVPAAWSGSGLQLALRTRTGVTVWEPETGQTTSIQLAEGGSIARLGLDFFGERLAVALKDGRLQVYDALTGRRAWSTAVAANAFRLAGALSFSPDGRWLAVGAEDLTLRLLNAADGSSLGPVGQLNAAPSVIAWRGDSRYFVTGGEETAATLWDVQTVRPVRRLPGLDEALAGAAFTAGGQQVVTLTAAFTVQVWDVADLE